MEIKTTEEIREEYTEDSLTHTSEVQYKKWVAVDDVKKVIDINITNYKNELGQHTDFIEDEIKYCKEHNTDYKTNSAVPQVQADIRQINFQIKRLEEIKKELGLE